MSLAPYLAPDQRRLFARFFEGASGFWWGRSAWRAWLLAILMISTVVAQLIVQYQLNYWNRYFFNAIERRDSAEILHQIIAFLPIAIANVALAVLSVWGG